MDDEEGEREDEEEEEDEEDEGAFAEKKPDRPVMLDALFRAARSSPPHA